RLLRVIILGMTSLHDTLEAVRSRRLTAAARFTARVVRGARSRLSHLTRHPASPAPRPPPHADPGSAQGAKGERTARATPPEPSSPHPDTHAPDRSRGVTMPPDPPPEKKAE